MAVAALRDRVRVLRSVGSGPRVEGRTVRTVTSDEWVPALLVVGGSREDADARGQRRVVERGELVVAGADVRPSDELQVQSRLHGDARWRVAGSPQTVAARTGGPVSVVPVERLVEPEADRL